MKILLTTARVPEEKRNPISILDLAAFLRAAGHSVDCFFLDRIRSDESVRARKYDLAGLSVLQVVEEDAPLRDAVYLKRTFASKVVVGGKWTETMLPRQEELLRAEGIDICVGQGEKYFLPGEADFGSYPPWSEEDFRTLGEANAEVMSARGCPYNCNFCHNTEKKLSFFSAARTAENVGLLFRLGVERIFFVDDIFTLRASRMSDLFLELKRREIDIEGRNYFFSHVNHLNEEILDRISLYRPTQVQLGIESGDDRMLKAMGKPFTNAAAMGKIRMLHERGIPVAALFLVGFPGETEESLKNTLAFIERIEPFVDGIWTSYYQPVRGTRGYAMAEDAGQVVSPGGRNTEITYVARGLTRELLADYRARMAAVFSRRSLGGFLRRGPLRRLRGLLRGARRRTGN